MGNEGHVTRKLVRRTDDKVIAGVCSGLADHLGVDPLLVRLGFVALGLTGGGVLAYLIAWALIPSPGGQAALAGLRRPTLGAALLAIAGLIAVTAVGGFLMNIIFPLVPGGMYGLRPEAMGLAALLVVAGILLLRERPVPAEPGAAPDAQVAAPAEVTAGGRARAALPRPPRERSGLVPLTLAVALLAGGGAGILASAGWVPLDVGQVAALSLVMVGLGLVVGGWFGRARLLIPVAILMIPLVLAASLANFPPSGTIGGGYVMPTRAGELENMRVLAGQVTLDLTEYPFSDGTEQVRLRVAAGSVNVHVPRDVHVDVKASVQGGEAYVLGGHEQGFDVSVAESAGPENTAKRLELELVAGFGTVGVYRVGSRRPQRNRQDGGRRERNDGKGQRGDRPGDEKGGKQ